MESFPSAQNNPILSLVIKFESRVGGAGVDRIDLGTGDTGSYDRVWDR